MHNYYTYVNTVNFDGSKTEDYIWNNRATACLVSSRDREEGIETYKTQCSCRKNEKHFIMYIIMGICI